MTNIESDEGFFLSLWRGQRRITINDQFSVTVAASGLPTVKWVTMEGTYNFFRKDNPEDRTWVIEVHENVATIGERSGNLVVTRQLTLRYISDNEHGDPWLAKRMLFHSANGEKTVLCDVRADDVQAFTLEQASAVELTSIDLTRFRAGKLLFDDHHLVRVELNDHTFGTLSRDLSDMDFSKSVVVALSREFIIKRPAGGWARKIEPLREAAVIASRRQKFIAQGAARWAKPQAPPVIYGGRKFAAYTQSPLESKDVKGETVYVGGLTPVTLDEFRAKWLVHPAAGVLHFPRGEELQATAHVFAFTVCSDGKSYATTAMVRFHSIDSSTNADTVHILLHSQHGYRKFEKQMSTIREYHIFTGKDFTIPRSHLPHDDAALSDDALIVAIEFSDGEFIPLTYATDTPFERLNEQRADLMEAQRVCGLREAPKASEPATAPVVQGRDGHDPI